MAQPDQQSPYWLLVEGTDDRCSIIHLLMRHGYDWNDEKMVRPFVRDAIGVPQLLDSLGAHVKSHERLGVVLDADDNLQARWRELRSRFSNVGIELPRVPDPQGVVLDTASGKLRRVGAWLMPDNTLSGYLEHFLEKLVPSSDSVWVHAGSATQAALNIGAPLSKRDEIKGTLHAWLAWQEDPGLPFGTALRARLFACDSPEAIRFVAWFHRLFDP